MKECTTCNNAKKYKDMCPECRADIESLLNDLLRGNGDNKYVSAIEAILLEASSEDFFGTEGYEHRLGWD